MYRVTPHAITGEPLCDVETTSDKKLLTYITSWKNSPFLKAKHKSMWEDCGRSIEKCWRMQQPVCTRVLARFLNIPDQSHCRTNSVTNTVSRVGSIWCITVSLHQQVVDCSWDKSVKVYYPVSLLPPKSPGDLNVSTVNRES